MINRGNTEAVLREAVPFGWRVSNAGKLLANVLDMTALRGNLLKALNDGKLGIFNHDLNNFATDLQTYFDNHSKGLPGENAIGVPKKNAIDSLLFAGGTKANRAANPVYGDFGTRGTIRTYRLDRIQSIEPTGRTGLHFDYDKVNHNLMPDAPERPAGSAMPDVGLASPERNPLFPIGKSNESNYSIPIQNDPQNSIHKGFPSGFSRPETPTSLPRIASAADLILGGEHIAIPAQSALSDVASARPSEYALKSHFSEIDQQESALLDWAKRNNRFISNDEVSKFEAHHGNVNQGGSEHNTWKVRTPAGKVIIRKTIKDSYGFAHRSPFQYLQRMADVSSEVQQAPISILGMSQNGRGNGVIWTVQPYVEGSPPEKSALINRLGSQGWKEVKTEHAHLVFEHGPTSIRMHDVHPGNFIQTSDGHQVPIDVFFEGVK